MTHTYSSPPSLSSSTAMVAVFEPAGRLLVLVSDPESNYIPVIRRISELANVQRAHVLLLCLCNDPRQELSLRRGLVTMCAMLQRGIVSAEAKVEIGRNWVDVVKRNYQTGDMIVCFAEQRAGFLQKPLSQILDSNLTVPVYIVSGVHIPMPKSHWFGQVTKWIGLIGIIIGFCMLQVKIVQLPKDWFQNILLLLSVIPEFRLIWVWNNLFR